MSLFFNDTTVQPACTSNVHRPLGGIAGLREVHDDVGRLTVSAFPVALGYSRERASGREFPDWQQ
ncbi:hypothetical protein LRP30_37270 [Bradyrhizobium sp. C-145]|uniref:hypothetical protein n=1 Tax=Bradyrhizobium sp. C-145 TaxID=574727 RepID=UPI00201B7339|nr:hypothetical protein [Bradyrhizobium sp. C-145]UQR62352.1 hypothetical protein LRP30_37270 [Bradyrhizobium sp. C-145]